MSCFPMLSDTIKNHIIIGGGPVGCYLAYKLLNQTGSRVFVFEGRQFERPQVIRIPFCIAKNLPEPVKNVMWFDEETRLKLFSSNQADDINFWPKPEYPHWPWINVGLFQESFMDYIKNNPAYKNRFFFIPSYVDLEQMNFGSEIKKFFPQEYLSIIKNITAIYCTCGNYAESLRKKLNLLDGKIPETKGHGIYLIYQNKKAESYLRNSNPISYAKLAENGISYAASNNLNYDVQLYTYPAGELSSAFNKIPESFIQQVTYHSLSNAHNMTGEELSSDAKLWLEDYRTIIETETRKAGIELPDDLAEIKVFYASRKEYFWSNVAAKWQWHPDSNAHLLFVGDSAGSTDYKFGLSVGRGFLLIEKLVASIKKHQHALDKVCLDYQANWDKIISKEFNKGSLLPSEPWILYQYLVKGREVKFSDKLIHYSDDKQYENYLDEYQNHFPIHFSKTSEASSVLYINAKAITENIQKIMDFGKSCSDSKIIGVVKSNGYGLGAKLVSDLCLDSGIDFLAVAKLQEAVALRNSGISDSARLMVFETPMIYDLSTYADNEIEVILPVDREGSSVKMVEKWLRNKLRTLNNRLKVHIMVDTGLRRDSGHISSLPESVMQTILKLQNLDPNQIEFAGVSTHLACYRCTDYKGEDVVNFRSLQFIRLKEVVEFLLLNGIKIPLIHIGGGLSLLAEKWPLQFAALSKKHKISLYTRVGHGLYGIELEKDLHVKCPKLRSVIGLEFQVRNVFFVEEGEPVSYGGYWRAPEGGVWIATLSGGWAEGIPHTAKTLGESQNGIMVSIKHNQYPIVGKINMNALMINLGSSTKVKQGDRAVIFGWREHEPKLIDVAKQSDHICASVIANIPVSMPRIVISE